MKIIFLNYNILPNYHSPEEWIKKIAPSDGISEALCTKAEVHYIIRIGCVNESVHNGVHYHFLKRKKFDTLFPTHLHKLVKDIAPDVVVVLGLHFLVQVIQLRLETHAGIIVQNHGGKPSTGYKKIVQQIADRCIDIYLFASAAMGERWLINNVIKHPEKIKEVMPASSYFYLLDKETARKRTGIKGNLVYLWVGTLDQNKDPLTVIKAFVEYALSHPSAKLYMIYHTTDLLPVITNFIKEKGCENSVVLIGQVAHEEMVYWFNSADFFVTGSHSEVFGIALVEAMSCGCIPIVTAIPSFKKITEDGKIGFLYPPGDVDALAQIFLKSYSISKKEYADAVVEHFNNELSFQKIAADILKLCKQLTNK